MNEIKLPAWAKTGPAWVAIDGGGNVIKIVYMTESPVCSTDSAAEHKARFERFRRESRRMLRKVEGCCVVRGGRCVAGVFQFTITPE